METLEHSTTPPDQGHGCVGTPQGRTTGARMRRFEYLAPRVLLAVLLAGLIAAWVIAYQVPVVGTFHDDAIIVGSAKSLAEGDGYLVPSLPDEIAQTKYPIAFPALVAVVWKLFPDFPANIPYLKIVPLLFAILWFRVTYAYVIEEGEKTGTAVLVVLLTAASPWVIFLGTAVLSETMFAFCLTTSLLLLRRIERSGEGKGWRLAVLAALFSGFTYLVRAAALPLFAAAVSALLLRKRFRLAALYVAIVALIVGPWTLWQSEHNFSGNEYSYYTTQAYEEWSLFYSYSLPEKVQIAALNSGLQLLWPVNHLGVSTGVCGLFVCLLLTGLLIFRLTCRLGREWSVTHIFLTLSLGMLVLWPWPPARFMSPLLPLLILPVIQGWNWVIRRLNQGGRTSAAIRLAGLAFLVVSVAFKDYMIARQTNQLGMVYPHARGQANWGDYEGMYRWVNANLPEEAVVNCILDPTLYLYTGRRAVRGYTLNAGRLVYFDDQEKPLGGVSEFLRKTDILGVTHVVFLSNRFFSESAFFKRLIEEVKWEYPGLLELLKTGPNGAYRVWAVNRALLPERGAGATATQSATVGRTGMLDSDSSP